MISIAFLNRKGGVGKSTLACAVAGAMFKAGHKVALLDLDEQKNVAKWGVRRQAHDVDKTNPLVRSVEPGSLPDALSVLSGAEYTHAIVDTRGVQDMETGYAATRCKLAVVPLSIAQFDAEATAETLERLTIAKTPYVVVLNNVQPTYGAARIKAGREMVEALLTPYGRIAGTIVRHRTAYNDAASQGRTIFELKSKGKEIEEISDLCNEIKELEDLMQ